MAELDLNIAPLKQASLVNLLDKIENGGLEKKYTGSTFEYPLDFIGRKSGIELSRSINLDGEKKDIDNAITLYEALKLNESQASDPRLWTALAHRRFWGYMHKRWPIGSMEMNKAKGRVLARYVLKNSSLNSLTRHGISRLWWYAHLTHDNARKDKYELTRVLLSRQDLAVGMLERELGIHPKTRRCMLEFLGAHPVICNNENLTRDFLKAVNLMAGVRNITMLGHKDLMDAFEAIAATLKVPETVSK